MSTSMSLSLSEIFKELYTEFLNTMQFTRTEFKNFIRIKVECQGIKIGIIYE